MRQECYGAMDCHPWRFNLSLRIRLFAFSLFFFFGRFIMVFCHALLSCSMAVQWSCSKHTLLEAAESLRSPQEKQKAFCQKRKWQCCYSYISLFLFDFSYLFIFNGSALSAGPLPPQEPFQIAPNPPSHLPNPPKPPPAPTKTLQPNLIPPSKRLRGTSVPSRLRDRPAFRPQDLSGEDYRRGFNHNSPGLWTSAC